MAKDNNTFPADKKTDADAAFRDVVREAEEFVDDGADTSPEKPSPGKRVVKGLIQYGLPLVLTVWLVWYMFQKVDFYQMLDIMRHGVDYWWILAMMTVSVFSHVFRAARWRLQLAGLGIRPPFLALCCSIFGTYALNLVFPRLGEIWRCTYIAGREKSPFTKVVGSMVADRLSDTLMVLLITLFTFIVAAPALNAFLSKYPVGRDFLNLLANPVLWICLVVAVGLGWWLLRLLRDTRVVKWLKDVCRGLWDGFAVVARMRGRGQFAGFTICIWTCYFMQLYLAFFAFPFTRELCADSSLAFGLTPALVAFVLSSIGMAIPSNGGLGPWNIAVMFGLLVYGVSESQGVAFSMLVWSAQTVTLLLLGVFTMIYIAVDKKAKR